jgi:hypothetical protein
MSEKDIAQRFREEAGLTEEDCSVELTNLQYRAQAGEDIRWDKVSVVIKNAQLNKAFSTKSDGRYQLALIDTKGESPDGCGVFIKTAENMYEFVEKSLDEMGYKKVVHVFGEKE